MTKLKKLENKSWAIKLESNSNSITVQSKGHSEVVEKIVIEWNNHVNLVQNNTIKLCVMISELTKEFPKESVKDILNDVKQHPNIKRFVSIDRIWQGMRLINRRPELIDFVSKSDKEKDEMSVQQMPYIKKDGEVFWEYYFELEKHGLNPLERDIIEKEGKSEGWTCKQLREKIQDKKDELAGNGNIYAQKQLKLASLSKCVALLKSMPYEKVIDAEKLLIALSRQNLNEVR